MSHLETFEISSFETPFDQKVQLRALQSLEGGKIVYFPKLPFTFFAEEKIFYNPSFVDPRRKNISYDGKLDTLGGSLAEGNQAFLLKEMLKRYSQMAKKLIENLFPHYVSHLKPSKTSFRPAEIKGRQVNSIRKDDTRLHIDAFPSNPTKGDRILRVFTNVNPDGKPRVWKVGEPFEGVVKKFAKSAPNPLPLQARFLQFLKITKSLRTSYDHYMLCLHNKMKEDERYQKEVEKEEIHFPSGSTWIVFTDQVSHSALSGQHVFEQTFFLPPVGLYDPKSSPLGILENFFRRQLI